LVDEVILVVCPVLVGAGKRFFENSTITMLTQVGVEEFSRGVIALTYVPSTSDNSTEPFVADLPLKNPPRPTDRRNEALSALRAARPRQPCQGAGSAVDPCPG
jgi:hypothetical protein